MKRLFICILIIALLAGCGSSYSAESTAKKFKLDDVSLVTLSGPNTSTNEGTSVELKPGQGDYAKLVQLVQGEKLEQCPTQEFGLCIITYTINTGETIKVYPANDQSNYVCLFSINPAISRYLELPAESMNEIRRILETNYIQVVYS